MAPPSSNAPRPARALATLLAIIVVLLIGILGKDAFQPAHWSRNFHVQLGLDLSSGTAVTLGATTLKGGAPPASDMDQAVQIMNQRVNGAGFTEASVQKQGTDTIVVSVPGKNAQQVISLVGTTAQMLFRQVLMQAQGVPAPAATPTPSASVTPRASSSPTVSPSASSSAHAAGDPASGVTGQGLAASSAVLAAASASPSASASATPSASPSPSPSSSASAAIAAEGGTTGVDPSVLALFNKLDCSKSNWKQLIGYTTASAYDNKDVQIVSCDGTGYKYVLDKSQILGTMITGASAGLPSNGASLSQSWQVNLTFNGTGARLFSNLTSQMFTQYCSGCTGANATPTSVRDEFAIVLDGAVVSAPQINQGAITGGSALITGSFSEAQATQLANVLKYGSLPLTFTNRYTQSVSAQLGRDQLDAGLIAAAIGLALVVVYSFLYYRGLGLVSVSSLVIASLLSFEAVVLLSKYEGFALSLAGVAGLIVAIGITADSFVVFFERLRDEVREGRSLRPAVESGWKRARRTILVSDTVSFLAAVLLYYFAIGEVKGFAYTLGLTTLIDVVVVFLFTKPMVTLLAGTRFYGGGHRLSGLDPGRLGARAPWRSPGGAVRPRPRTTARSARSVKEA